jgi:hypothetical protein
MFLQLFTFPFYLLQYLLYKFTTTFTALSLLYAVFNHLGIIKRLLIVYIEHEVSSIANGAPISITDIQFQLLNYSTLQSTIILYDSIIHTPHPQKWKWESPLIARIGYVKVSFNLLSLIDLPPHWKQYLGIRMQSIKDIYVVEMRDVQVFVEKRRNVFNFHLLDERLDVPDPEEVWKSLRRGDKALGTMGEGERKSGSVLQVENGGDRLDIPVPGLVGRSSSSAASSLVGGVGGVGTVVGVGTGQEGGMSRVSNGHANRSDVMSEEDVAEDTKKADELVTSIVQAVSSLGRAANEGGTRALSDALRNQKDGFVNHLRKVQNMVALNSTDDKDTTVEQQGMTMSSNHYKEKKQNKSIGIAKEGIQVMKQVGKVVEKNVLNMKEQVDALSKPPPIRKDWKPMEYPDLFRFGYIVLKDARIFTKDIILVSGGDEKKTQRWSDESSIACEGDKTPTRVSINARGWSKPIAIKEVVLCPSELCPPKDKENPSTIGQPIEVYSNLVLERVFTEMATSSISGKLLNNAFMDVFALFDDIKQG